MVSGAEGGEQSLDRLEIVCLKVGTLRPCLAIRQLQVPALLSVPSVTRPDFPFCPGWALPTAETVPSSPAHAPLTLSRALGWLSFETQRKDFSVISHFTGP